MATNDNNYTIVYDKGRAVAFIHEVQGKYIITTATCREFYTGLTFNSFEDANAMILQSLSTTSPLGVPVSSNFTWIALPIVVALLLLAVYILIGA